MGVDFETRVDFRRLQRYRLARAHAAPRNSECRALLLFDVNNIRYVSGTKIGEWERDKFCRFALLGATTSRSSGTSARLRSTTGCTATGSTPRAAGRACSACAATIPPSFGLMRAHAEAIMALLREAGCAGEPVGVDVANRDAVRAAANGSTGRSS